MKSSDAGLMVDHDDDDTNFACDKESQSSSDTTSSLSFTVELEDEFFPNYKDSVPKQQKTSVASDMLAEFVNDEGGFDVAVIRACRKLVSNHLLDFADTITPGVCVSLMPLFYQSIHRLICKSYCCLRIRMNEIIHPPSLFPYFVLIGGLTYRQLIEAQQLSLEQYCTEVGCLRFKRRLYLILKSLINILFVNPFSYFPRWWTVNQRMLETFG